MHPERDSRFPVRDDFCTDLNRLQTGPAAVYLREREIQMKEKLTLVELLFNDLLKNFNEHIRCREIYKKEYKQRIEGTLPYYPCDNNSMNKNHGKVALKRKITLLRQELLNLERMLDIEQ